jgi:hypothetical protein
MYSGRDDAALPAFGFPHSGIHGSKAVQRLTVAYRSRPRPSSTPDAKASTVCPSYLDGDQLGRDPKAPPELVILPIREGFGTDAESFTFRLANCAVFKVRREAQPGGLPGWSLKTQQYAGAEGDQPKAGHRR